LNDLMLAGTLCGIEMGLELSQVPHQPGGVLKALAYLTQSATKDQARDKTG
jgi:alanine-glyoxylate transaminase/serine-glyoxylate transaminase/serine-pyruvate transaminase